MRIEGWAEQARWSPKLAVNAPCGVFGSTDGARYTLHQSQIREELVGLGPGWTTHVSVPSEDGTSVPLWELCVKHPVLKLCSHRPVSDQVLGLEACLLVRLRRLCESIPSAIAVGHNTDGSLLACHTRFAGRLVAKVKEVCFRDGSPVSQLKNVAGSKLKTEGHAYRESEERMPRLTETRCEVRTEE